MSIKIWLLSPENLAYSIGYLVNSVVWGCLGEKVFNSWNTCYVEDSEVNWEKFNYELLDKVSISETDVSIVSD